MTEFVSCNGIRECRDCVSKSGSMPSSLCQQRSDAAAVLSEMHLLAGHTYVSDKTGSCRAWQ